MKTWCLFVEVEEPYSSTSNALFSIYTFFIQTAFLTYAIFTSLPAQRLDIPNSTPCTPAPSIEQHETSHSSAIQKGTIPALVKLTDAVVCPTRQHPSIVQIPQLYVARQRQGDPPHAARQTGPMRTKRCQKHPSTAPAMTRKSRTSLKLQVNLTDLWKHSFRLPWGESCSQTPRLQNHPNGRAMSTDIIDRGSLPDMTLTNGKVCCSFFKTLNQLVLKKIILMYIY